MSATPDSKPSIIDEAKAKAEERVRELEPLVAEHRELSEFLTKLAAPIQVPQPDAAPAPTPTPRADVDAALARQGAGKGGSKKRRKRQGGTTADKALAVVKGNPGIGASDIAEKLGIKPNYLYRVMADLTKDKAVTKDGRGYSIA